MTDKIRWFRCVNNNYYLTIGKLYPVNPETGYIADDSGEEREVADSDGRIYYWLEEVITDD